MDAADIEEMNRLRVSMGMKPLPVPGGGGGGGGPQFKEKSPVLDDGEEPASTLETREAASYANYKRAQDEEAAKKKRSEKLAAIKKARDAAKRQEVLQGKGLGEADDADELDAKAWLKGQGKRQKKIDKARKYEAQIAAEEAAAAAAVQYTSKDLEGITVGHESTAFEDGDEHIMTLKDSNVLGDDEDGADELENVDLRDREKLKEKIELKKKKPVYDVHATDDGEHSILAQYDEEIGGKKRRTFALDAQGNTVLPQDENAQANVQPGQKFSLDVLEDDKPASDYLDISEIKVKKPKKKKTKATRQRPADDDNDIPALEPPPNDQSMEIDSGNGFISKKRKIEDTSYVDDEDLQATLAAQRRQALKKRKRTRPEDLARQLREEAQTPDPSADEDASAGLVIDETSEFVSGLKKEDIEERKPRKPQTPANEPVTAMGNDSDEDEPMRDGYEVDQGHTAEDGQAAAEPETAAIGVDEEKTIGTGVGAALQLLRDRRLIATSGSGDLNDRYRQHDLFIAEKKHKMEQIEQLARDQRERDRNSGRLERMSARDREEWARQQNTIRDQQSSRQMAELFNKGYKPNVELKYYDEHGRSLDQKEAFKHLSHQFHGKGSGKGKTDKLLKKVEDERRRESQSMLDASQSIGMSSATAQQTKKRKEAGVRLA